MDPPAKEECPICFLPMPEKMICCMSLPPATVTSVPINDFAMANMELADIITETYFSCCGKGICGGCVDSFHKSGNARNCPFCKAKTVISDHKRVEQMKKRVEANDTGTMVVLANQYLNGSLGLQQDWAKTVELLTRASELGSGRAHFCLGGIYEGRGDLKKAKFHLEAAAMAGHEQARFNIGLMEYNLGSTERSLKHWTIAASAGCFRAMHNLKGYTGFSRDEIDPILTAYNNSCAEMRSEARDAYMRRFR